MSETPDGLSITTTCGLMEVVGELDAHTACLLQAHLEQLPDGECVTLELSAVTFIDSTGLAALIAAHRRSGEDESPVTIVRPSRAVERLIEISGLQEHFNIVSN